jgi:hypothetical protein
VSQDGTGDRPPYWYGQVIEVHPGGDYLKFCRAGGAWRWYHRRDVHLHPLAEADGQPLNAQALAPFSPEKGFSRPVP